MQTQTIIGKNGRIVIPASYRKALGIKPGDAVFVRLEGKEIRILTRRQAIERARTLVSRYVSVNRSLAKALLAERRIAARDE